ncbi:snaclec 3-like [Hippocampus comes]|uniref:snaclec 3-like n=1 Tax=Hippocampus comes TaxID=109280 RepID=UPI00094F0AF0|nr:PREDICTED: snaclec 3-like [Hippocampus comes]
MAISRRSLILLCVITALLTEVRPYTLYHKIVNNCPPKWTQLDCNCYIYQNEERTFADAESVCNILGGNLVSIHSALENIAVQELAKAGGNDNVTWIGFNDAIQNDNFIWTDGTLNDFERFNETESQPDNTVGDCVVIAADDGYWQTANCTDLEPYVCIREVFHR